jgi:2-polyprenyl-6-methoxyphenol hydroxylase-like FAD-dependent oxidoreductase
MKIAINGCGVAGPALAFWLLKSGHEPVLIEQAPRLREGGYVIDFWGIGYDIAEKMGLIPQLRAAGYQVNEVRFVNARGRRIAGFSADVFRRMTGDRFTSLRRSDLAAVLFSAVEGQVETIFGDSIAAIEDHADGVRVTFDHSAPRAFDLVIGADGLHSRVRRIAFGPDEQFEARLGFHVAAFDAKAYRPRDELVYVSHTRPGRQISRFSMRDDRTLFLFIFRDELLDLSVPASDEGYRAALRHVFGKDGWECATILAAMDSVDDLYFDRVSQIRMNTWARGRTALIGDAAACVSLLAGEGTGLAIAEAYVLAGELARAGGHYIPAFAAYQERMMPLLRQKQESAKKFASTFAPASTLGIAVRNLAVTFLRIPVMADFLVGRDLRDDIELPHYAWGRL